MILHVDPLSAVPPYEQIRQQVKVLVAGRSLPPGTRLPPIRQLANDLGLAGGTVARAYRELESDGIVRTRGRHGTIVAQEPAQESPAPVLLDAARRYATEATQSGASLDDALVAVQVAFALGRNR